MYACLQYVCWATVMSTWRYTNPPLITKHTTVSWHTTLLTVVWILTRALMTTFTRGGRWTSDRLTTSVMSPSLLTSLSVNSHNVNITQLNNISAVRLPFNWRRSIVVRTLVSASKLSLSCARLLGDHFVVKPSAIGQPTWIVSEMTYTVSSVTLNSSIPYHQPTWPTQPSIPQGSVNE